MTPAHPLSRRASGLLLHPSSLPGPHGIGTLGPAAARFVDFLAEAGQRLWQVLPLGATGEDGSPYQSPSSHAGNPALVDLEPLAAEGWLEPEELAPLERLSGRRVDYKRLLPLKAELLRAAAGRFRHGATGEARAAFERFRAEAEPWLAPYAEFMARKHANGGAAWTEWTRAEFDPEEARAHEFAQFLFYSQWQALRVHCRRRGVRLLGDVPIFVAHDSVDVFSDRALFDLDAQGRPRTVAGVPPDYFSATGQLWGNPLYVWERHAAEGFRWWIDRLASTLRLVDVVRIDHFRGLEAFYEIPAGAKDAREGRWVPAPGERFLSALDQALGGLPFVAEDLGTITPAVEALRDRFGLPGMRVLQFAFGDEDGDHVFRPHNYHPNVVAYTGTHDNDTTVGWYRSGGGAAQDAEAARAERDRARRYLGSNGREIHWDFIRAALGSVARTAIVPLQDVLGLGSSARLNHPGTTARNWSWRVREEQLRPELAQRLRELCRLYGR